jgi:SAM-dependent methyltransferase
VGRFLKDYRFSRFAAQTREEVFNEVYRKKMWTGGSAKPSGAGSYGEMAEQYLHYIGRFIDSKAVDSIVDVGCGDFNIGSKLSRYVKRYIALDVSSEIIERNKITYAELSNVEFQQLDACSDQIPLADLVIVRQVLQHLTNAEIEDLLSNVEKSGTKYVIIVEHHYDLDKSQVTNIDLQAHGPYTRVEHRSGVNIMEPPFSKEAKLVERIPIPFAPDEFLYMFLWEPTRSRKAN